MPIEDFDLSPDLSADPLDVTGFGGTPPFVPPQRQGGMSAMKDFAPLLALMPIVAKSGGRDGIAALLRGMQRARANKAAQGRLTAQDQRMASQEERMAGQARSQDEARQAAAQNAELQRRQQFMGQFNTALGGVDSPEAVKALLDFYGGQADSFGVPRPELEKFAMGSATPDVLTTRKVSKRWEKMGVEARELAQRTQASLQIDGQTIPYQQWAPLVGGMVDPKTGGYPVAPVAAPRPDALNTPEERIAAALRSGDTAAVQLEEDALRRVGNARREADDPRLADIQRQIAEARLENMQGAKNTEGLPPRILTRVESKQKGWDSLPIVKTTQKMAEAVQFANSLDINTTNPADDQALIYAFAKAMDPDSVVREGEYATVQKYAQDWASTLGFNAARIFSNTPFLTTKARQNMKKTIQARYSAGKVQYDNVRRQYAKQINQITGLQDGEDRLTDYGGGFPSDEPTTGAQPARVVPPSGGRASGPAPGPNPFRR